MRPQTDPSGGQLVFVVQKHQARSLHYDFRLEAGGVLRSWAVPKGPSLDSRMKRLAMPTDDHPLEYRHFEGVIEKGEYGAGPVMIWDEGTYNPQVETSQREWIEVKTIEEADAAARTSLGRGELKFVTYGKKLRGSFALVRTSGFGGKVSWLLIKHRDEQSVEGYDANNYDFSAVSSLSMAQISARSRSNQEIAG